VVNTGGGARAPRYALAVSGGRGVVSNPVGEYLDLAGVTRFRCRLMTPGPQGASVVVRLVSPERAAESRAVLAPGQWKTVDLDWKGLGFESERAFRRVGSVELQVPGGAGVVYVDDVTFRRPPRRLYELVKLVHCVLPTLAGLLAAAVCLPLLRFEEVGDVRRWVRERGWRRRSVEAREGVGEQLPE